MYFAGLSLLVSLAAFTAAGLVPSHLSGTLLAAVYLPQNATPTISPRTTAEVSVLRLAPNRGRFSAQKTNSEFCYYDKTSGALTAKYPNYISCPSIAKPNPECTYTRRTEPLPQRAANPAALLADGVSLARFARHPSPTADE